MLKIVSIMSLLTILFSCSNPVEQGQNLTSNSDGFDFKLERNANEFKWLSLIV